MCEITNRMWSPRIVKPLEIGLGLKLVPAKHRGKWLRTALDGSGPVGIKFGQFISNRSDIFGKELSRDLAPLRDKVTPINFEKLALKIPPEITDVDPVPLACASIAQVHRATLRGRSVVIKFKRPDVEHQIKEDLNIIENCSKILSFFGIEIKNDWFREFEKGLLAEVDFSTEIRNISIFRDIYRDHEDIRVPRPYSKFSGNDVIVMDYVPSKPIEFPFPAERLISLFIDQILYEGIIHGDLHSGNIGVDEGVIVMYDFGNVIRISPAYKNSIREFIYSVQTANVDSMIENMKNMGILIQNEDIAKIFVNRYLKYIQTLDIKSFSVNSVEFQEQIKQVPVQLDSTTLSILRSYTLLEGLAKEVDPDFSYEKILTKSIETLLMDLEYISYRFSKDTGMDLT